MDELIKSAVEVCDALRYCVACVDYGDPDVTECKKCVYCNIGCINTLMLDAVNVIERLVEEVDDGKWKATD